MLKSMDFSLQARMGQVIGANLEPVQATQFQAFAMQTVTPGNESDRIHVEISNNRTGTVFTRYSINCAK